MNNPYHRAPVQRVASVGSSRTLLVLEIGESAQDTFHVVVEMAWGANGPDFGRAAEVG